MTNTTISYMCRVNVPLTRLFTDSDSITPCGKFVERGKILYTDYEKEYYDGTIRMRIYEPDEYAGLWIVKRDCDTMPIANCNVEHLEKDNSSIYKIHITSNNPVVYKSSDSSTRIISKLKAGDICLCDDRNVLMSNGILETRYHITGFETSGDKSLIDYWILCDAKVINPKAKKVISIPVKAKESKAIPEYKESNKNVRRGIVLSSSQQSRVSNPMVRDYGVVSTIVVDVTQKDESGNLVWENPGAESPEMEITNSESYTVDTNSTGNVSSNIDKSSVFDFTSVGISDLELEKIINMEDSEEALLEFFKRFDNDDERDGSVDVSSKDDYDFYSYSINYDNNTFMNIPIRRLGYVHGLPFQYTYITDRRIGSEMPAGAEDLNSDLYGRTFAQEIVANIPVAVFVPGEADFLSAVSKTGFIGSIFGLITSKSKKEQLKAALVSDGDAQASTIEDFLSSGDGQYDYFTMRTNLSGYFQIVNSMTRFMAKSMGLGKRKINGKTVSCDKVDWGNYNADVDKNSDLASFLSLDGGVAFAFDPQSAITDSISNSTGDSKLAGLLNQGSSTVREVNFVMGAAAGKDLLNSASEQFATTSTTGSGGLIDRLSSLLSNTVSGLNVRFPEIWQDSSSSKDYSIDLKFVAPYATPFCIWRYVLVPFAHVLGLAGARSLERVNSYSSPPLIRAFSKGYFNVEMGIITGFTWKKFGEGDMMSDDGLPTEIDVSLQFKDLYHSLSVSPWKLSNIGLFFNNTGLIDLLGTLCGMNMNRANFKDRLELYLFAISNSAQSVPENIIRHINDRIRDVASTFLHLG